MIFDGRSRRSIWCSEIPAAVEAARAISASSDAYFSLALHSRARAVEAATQAGKEKPENTRGGIESANTIGGVWLDLDVANDHHKKPGLPTSVDVILRGLYALPLLPTVCVSTGGGVHAYWAFREPWELDSDRERARAYGVVDGWQRFVSLSSGWTVDPTADLARVLRLPETVNYKYGAPVVVVGDKLGPLYNPSDFDTWASEARPKKRAVLDVGSLRLDPEANAPAEKLLLALQLDADFSHVWRGERAFPSQSERDLSLADRLASYGWSDQEIVDALIANRRLLGVKEKADRGALRLDYYVGRVALARATHARAAAEEARTSAEATLSYRLSEAPDPVPLAQAAEGSPARAPDPDDPVAKERREWLETLSKTIGVRILRLVRYSGDPASYHLWLEGGHVDLGGVAALMSRQAFAAHVYDATGRVVPEIKAKTWNAVVLPVFSRVMEHEDLGEESGHEERLDSFLRGYFDSVNGIGTDRAKALATRAPWEEDGVVWGFLSSLMRYQMANPIGAQIAKTSRELARIMRTAGLSSHVFAYTRADGRATSTMAWRLTPVRRASPAHAAEAEREHSTGAPF